jgi:6-phosphogluconolactonase
VLVLSGGPTARACYEDLADVGAASIDWDLVTVLMGDERCVGPDDPDANQLLVRQSLLDQVAPVAAFLPMSADEGPFSYQNTLESYPTLDFLHLGFGPDGHTASMFPGSPDLDSPPGVLVVRTSDPKARNPHDRLSLTFEAISRADTVVFTVAGKEKADAFHALTTGADLPAARVRATHVIWLVDHAAAGY